MSDQPIPPAGQAQGGVQPPKRSFTIPEDVKTKYPDLIDLVLGSSSMNDDERQYWFSILPIMTDEQVQRLREILLTEKQKLAEIDAKYQKQLDTINDQHLIEWQSIKSKQQKENLQKAETTTKNAEQAEEQALLNELDQL